MVLAHLLLPRNLGATGAKENIATRGFSPWAPPDAPETPQEGGDRLKIEPSNRGNFALVSQRLRNFAQSSGHGDVPSPGAVLRPAKKNRPLQERTEQDIDKFHTGGYTKNRKGAAGRRSAPQIVTRSNRRLWGQIGRLLLFAVMYLQEQAANANDNQTELKQLRICQHGHPLLSAGGGEKSPSGRWRGYPPTVTGNAER